MVNITLILSLRLSIASGVMTPAILVTATFYVASILYVPFFVLIDIFLFACGGSCWAISVVVFAVS
jgi:hypothetical protein